MQDEGWFYGITVSRTRALTARSFPHSFPPAKNGILKRTCYTPCLSRLSSSSSSSSWSSDEEWESWGCSAMPQKAHQAGFPRLAQDRLDIATVQMACNMFGADAAALGLVHRRTNIWAQCSAFNG